MGLFEMFAGAEAALKDENRYLRRDRCALRAEIGRLKGSASFYCDCDSTAHSYRAGLLIAKDKDAEWREREQIKAILLAPAATPTKGTKEMAEPLKAGWIVLREDNTVAAGEVHGSFCAAKIHAESAARNMPGWRYRVLYLDGEAQFRQPATYTEFAKTQFGQGPAK